jgi:hypothetical protein
LTDGCSKPFTKANFDHMNRYKSFERNLMIVFTRLTAILLLFVVPFDAAIARSLRSAEDLRTQRAAENKGSSGQARGRLVMWTRFASLVLCLGGGTAYAQSAIENAPGLESCFEAARLADTICSKLQIPQTERVDCFKKAGAAQLECREHVLSKAPDGVSSNPSKTARLVPRGNIASPGSSPDPSGKKDERSAQKADWILSETTSPVDFSPLVTAVIRATSDVKDSLNSLAVRCRSQHTELSVKMDGALGEPRSNELMVEYQINDHAMVRQPWILSADGKTAIYRNDPVEFLRSMPEGATMRFAVTDKRDVRHETTFELTGLSGVRQKVGTACKWASVTAKSSSDRR